MPVYPRVNYGPELSLGLFINKHAVLQVYRDTVNIKTSVIINMFKNSICSRF